MIKGIAKSMLLFLAAGAVSCSEGNSGYTIDGTVKDVENGMVYLKQYVDKNFITLDSAKVTDHRFRLEGVAEQPVACALTTDNGKRRPSMFFLENAEMNIMLDEGNNFINVEGSPLSKQYFDNFLIVDNDSYSIDSLIASNPKSPVAAYFLIRNFAWRLGYEEMKAARALFDKSLDGSIYLNQTDTLIKKLGNLQIGAMAPDFTMKDTEGKDVSLSSFRGKYVLIDFWASWCPDCRKESPELVAIHDKYRNSNIEFVGISLDRNREQWIAAIEKDDLDWIHLSDLGYWQSEVAQLYAVRWIPQNYLIDENGVIIGRSLSMQELDAALSGIFR